MSPQTLVEVQRTGGTVKQDSYIIKLKQGTDKKAHLDHLAKCLPLHQGLAQITHADWDSSLLLGYAGTFTDTALDILRAHPEIESLEEDPAASASDVQTQSNAPWGLSRLGRTKKIDGSSTSLDYNFTYDDTAGSKVDVYVIDTGIFVDNEDFGKRAKWGKNFVSGTPDDDTYGHGTQCAGIIGGKRWGVAKKCSLIGVKVLGGNGEGWVSDIISGISWAYTSARASSHSSVISLGFSGPVSKALNAAVEAVVQREIHVVAAAGNNAAKAEDYSPASARGVLTVGASNIGDTIFPQSNFGSSLDIFAPGQDITTAGIPKTDSQALVSGTSMAAAHIAGLVAYLIALQGKVSPAKMLTKLTDLSTKDALTDLPPNTVNHLARITTMSE